ncbi:MFS transporter, partial [Candidatus Bipolaricaulota bacterium]|nr:MFS transporter [Candidatus Bipolaricaulota bacterium]
MAAAAWSLHFGIHTGEVPGSFSGLVETAWVYGALLSLIFPFFLFPTFGWRATFLVALIPLSLIPVVAFFMPESLRYLQLEGKTSETLSWLKKRKMVPP